MRRRKLKILYDPYEWNQLATYNAEVARGIVHTPEWVEKMRLEQERFDAGRESMLEQVRA